jgi:virginiamycin B lyase
MKQFFLLLLSIPLAAVSQPGSPKIIDISQAAYKIIHVGEKPDFIATGKDEAWIVDDHQNRVIKVSPKSSMPLFIVPVPEACTAPVVDFNSLWVMSCSEKKLYRIDNSTGKILAKIPTGIADRNGEMSLATGDGSVWLLSDSTGVLIRVNPETNAVLAKIRVRPYSYCAAFYKNSIWITNYYNNSIQQINTQSNKVTATIPVGKNPRFLTAGTEGIWTLNQGDGTVSRVDIALKKVIATIHVKAPGSGGDISTGNGKVWVVSTNPARPVQMINAITNKIETIYSQHPNDGKKYKADGAVRLSENYVWISGYYDKTIWVLKK